MNLPVEVKFDLLTGSGGFQWFLGALCNLLPPGGARRAGHFPALLRCDCLSGDVPAVVPLSSVR